MMKLLNHLFSIGLVSRFNILQHQDPTVNADHIANKILRLTEQQFQNDTFKRKFQILIIQRQIEDFDIAWRYD